MQILPEQQHKKSINTATVPQKMTKIEKNKSPSKSPRKSKRPSISKDKKSALNSPKKNRKKVKDKYDELSFELTKKNAEVQEQTELKEVNENKLKDNVKQMEELNELSKSKDNLINTQNDTIKMYQDKINEYKKTKEDLEFSLGQNIYNFKMKEDEFESLLMVFEAVFSKKKDKYERSISKLSADVKEQLQSMVKKYKFFK